MLLERPSAVDGGQPTKRLSRPFATFRAKIAKRWARSDRLAVGMLIAIPILIYLPFSLAGFPVMPGDDLIQNYPLRVLSGAVIRSGRLPVWDPLIWSGTPLLGGWNAGAMFPGTWLFAVLPGVAAWTLNYLLVPVVAGVGFFVLLRRLRCTSLAAFLGALLFSDTGFLSGQVVHLGLTQGTALLPWMLVGFEGIARGRGARETTGSVALVGGCFALIVLAGDPRAATTAAIVAIVYALGLLIRPGMRRGLVAARSLEGLVLGIALSAIQWLPGLGFLHASQRGAAAYGFFGAGSLTPGHLGSLLTVPFLFGANGNFGLPIYGASFNLPEVTLGSGIVALVAAGVYLPELYRRYVDWSLRRRDPSQPLSTGKPLAVWYVLILVGIVLVVGADSPLGHLLVHIPLYGHERLQNRNGALIDVGLAVLAAFFVDDVAVDRRAAKARGTESTIQSVGPRNPLDFAWSRAVGLVPVLVTFAFGLGVYLVRAPLERDFHFPAFSSAFFHRVFPLVLPSLVLALLIGLVLLLAPRLRNGQLRIFVAILIGCDATFFLVNASYSTAPSVVLASSNPCASSLNRLTGPNGRSAIYNPNFAQPPGDPQTLSKIGVTDLNLLRNAASVQGYGSIVEGTYQDATNTHAFEDLNPGRLAGETYNTLDLRAFLTLPIYFQIAIPPGPIPLPNGQSTAGPGASGVGLPAPNPSGPWTLQPGASRTWLLATPAALARATIIVQPGGASGAVSSLQVGVGHDGATIVLGRVPVRSGQAHLRVPRGTTANTIVVRNPGSTAIDVGAVVAVTTHPALRLLLDGTLQGMLPTPHWRYVGTLGPLSAFENSETEGLAWLQPATSHSPETAHLAPGSVQVTSNGPSAPEQMVVHSPTSALLVRSETYSPGWTARLAPVGGGRTLVLASHRFGLVQAADIPAGDYVVTWKYAPTELLAGLVTSGVALAAFLMYCLEPAGRRRRSARMQRSETPQGAPV